MQRGTLLMLVAGILVATLALARSSSAMPMYQYGQQRHNKDYLVEVEDPDAVLEMLAKLGQSILKAQHEGTNLDQRRVDTTDAKRGLDLGLGRGFSGSQAAKHLMGLAAANFAAGPGKRKRAGDMGPGQDSSYGAPQDYLVPSPGSNEWILGNKE